MCHICFGSKNTFCKQQDWLNWRVVQEALPYRHMPDCVLKHVPKHVFRYLSDKHMCEHVLGHGLKQMAHAVPMTQSQRATNCLTLLR